MMLLEPNVWIVLVTTLFAIGATVFVRHELLLGCVRVFADDNER